MSKIFLATTLSTLLCASLAAQAPQSQPQDPSTSRVAPPAAGASAAPADPQSAAKKADTIAVEGCIQRGTGRPTAGTTGTTGQAAAAFMLTSVAKPAGSTSTAPIASSYQLDAIDSKLSPHVGHKVEITGTVEAAGSSSGGAAMAAPKLKVDNVKMIAANCTP